MIRRSLEQPGAYHRLRAPAPSEARHLRGGTNLERIYMASEQQLAEPTPADAMAISQAGAGAVDPSQSPEEMRAAVDKAIAEKAGELQVKLDPAERSAISAEMIRQLDAMGAFRKPEPEPEPDAADGGDDPEANGTTQDPPQKKNWIQRLVD